MTPLPDNPAYSVERLQEELDRAIHNRGAHAHFLYEKSRTLVDLIIPPKEGGSAQDVTPDRAIAVEGIIRNAVNAISEYDPQAAEALLIILGLKRNTLDRNRLQERRKEASRLYDVSPDTFHRAYESQLTLMLAFQIWRTQHNVSDKTSK